MNLKEIIYTSVKIVDRILTNFPKITPTLTDLEQLNCLLTKAKHHFQYLLKQEDLTSLNMKSTASYIIILNKYLSLLLENSKVWNTQFSNKDTEEMIIIKLKLESILQYIDKVPFISKNDLFSIEKSDKRWQSLNMITEKFHVQGEEKIRKKYLKIMEQIAIGQAVLYTCRKENEGIKRNTKLVFGSIYYIFMKNNAFKQAQLIYANPDLEFTLSMLNLLDKKLILMALNLFLKSIKFNQVIYLPKTVSHVLSDSYYINEAKSNYSLIQNNENVMIRILNHKKIDWTSKENAYCYDKCVYHFHGGGFICMSSASHQLYTRVWARDLKIPLISVDYRLAPTYPYPIGLDDSWQVINWIQNYGKDQIGIEPKEYVLVGDSAGGNLALALTYKIISLGLKPPSGLILAYPALNLDKNYYTPSLLKSLEDWLVPHKFLKLCVNSYLQNNENIKDPTISPINITEDILKKFPPIRIIIGTDDPLYDDCFRFAEKLLNCGNDVKIAEFFGASHGGLNLSYKGGIKETIDMVNIVPKWIKEILKIK